MPAKKRRHKPGLLWRVLFGHNGPTRGEEGDRAPDHLEGVEAVPNVEAGKRTRSQTVGSASAGRPPRQA